MRRTLLALPLLLATGWVSAQTMDCSAVLRPQSLPVRPTLLPPLAPELVVPSHQLGAPTGVLAQAFDESQSVDHVLLRMRIEGCRSIANAVPSSSPASGIIDPATYKPKTEFDNTPWRFNMSQNGKQMTADEFSAWMKARGVRVAKGGATVAAPAAAPGVAPAPTTPSVPADQFSMPPAAPAVTMPPAVPLIPAQPAASPQGN